MDPGRRRHYGSFYGLGGGEGAAAPEAGPADGPVTVVYGNCQAEALRVLLSTPTGPPTVRLPPVHELTAADLPHLDRLLARTTVLIAQPVRDGYRDLPLGTAQVAARCAPHGRLVRWPVVRWTGLHPFAATLRYPVDPSMDPPVVPYHDLRTLAAAAGRPAAPDRDADGWAAAVRAERDASVVELVRRECDLDVAVSDLLRAAGAAAAHTLNHPGNPVLIGLARRIQAVLDLPVDAVDPGRVLLGGVRAPVPAAVLAALGLPTATAREHWIVDGTAVDDADVRAAQLACYRADPAWVRAALLRHGDRMARLGL